MYNVCNCQWNDNYYAGATFTAYSPKLYTLPWGSLLRLSVLLCMSQFSTKHCVVVCGCIVTEGTVSMVGGSPALPSYWGPHNVWLITSVYSAAADTATSPSWGHIYRLLTDEEMQALAKRTSSCHQEQRWWLLLRLQNTYWYWTKVWISVSQQCWIFTNHTHCPSCVYAPTHPTRYLVQNGTSREALTISSEPSFKCAHLSWTERSLRMHNDQSSLDIYILYYVVFPSVRVIVIIITAVLC